MSINTAAQTTSTSTMLVYHTTSWDAAEAILQEGFKHPPLRKGECKGEREEAARLGVTTRPVFTTPIPILWECYGNGEVTIVIELDTSSHYTTYPGDSGAKGAERFYGKDFPVHLTNLGEIHLWEGITRYRVVDVLDLKKDRHPYLKWVFEYREEAQTLTVINNHEGGWGKPVPIIPALNYGDGLYVIWSYPEYGWSVAEEIPYYRYDDAIVVKFSTGEWAEAEPIPMLEEDEDFDI